MTQATHFTGLRKHLAYILQFCNMWSLLTCSQNKPVISVLSQATAFYRTVCLHRTRGGLVLSHTEKNYAQKSIFLVSLKFSLQIFWPQAIANIFVQCSAVWDFFLLSENFRSVFILYILLCCAILLGSLKFPQWIQFLSHTNISEHPLPWGCFQKMINWKE